MPEIRSDGRGSRWAPVTILLLALSASLTGLGNGFAYDDRPVVLQNLRLHHLTHFARLWMQTYWPPSMGAALYRPVTTLAFALEWWAGQGLPWVFHATNIALYAAVCLLVYDLAARILTPRVAWLAAALFAVHPVHVEAVANVVGQSELWAACAVIGAVTLYIRWRRAAVESMTGVEGSPVVGDARATHASPLPGAGEDLARRDVATAPPPTPGRQPIAAVRRWQGALVIALVIAACLSKEHAVVTPGLLLAAELLLVNDPRPWSVRCRALRPYALALVAAVLAYVVVRAHIVGAFAGDRPNVVFEHLSPGARRWTMLGVAADWVRLLVWPSRLAVEYAPREIVLYDHFDLGLLPIAGLLVAIVALTLLSLRQWPAGAFALVWLGVTLLLVSNLVVPTGVILAERTLFLPSVGIVLLAGAVVDQVVAAMQSAQARGAELVPTRVLRVGAIAIVALGLGSGIWQSARRQLVWRSNATVFTQAVADAPYSYRAHDVYAGLLFDTGDRAGGEREARIALALYPHNAVLYRDLANEYMRAGLCQAAVPLLRRSIAESTMQTDARLLLAECLLTEGNPDSARAEVLRGSAEGEYGPAYHKVLLAVDSAVARRRTGRGAAIGERTGAGAGAGTP